jgi:hypothetical protein
MVPDHYARLSAVDVVVDLPKAAAAVTRSDVARRHVINRNMQSRAGRLYCNEDWDFDMPALELYAAR